MTRLAILSLCLVSYMAAPAMATSVFNKFWREEFLDKDKVDDEFFREGRKAGCNICHVKGHPDKKEARNEYGRAIREYLKEDDFPSDWVKENEEEAKKLVLEGFKKANEHKSTDGEKFGDKLKAGKLPATDAEYVE